MSSRWDFSPHHALRSFHFPLATSSAAEVELRG